MKKVWQNRIGIALFIMAGSTWAYRSYWWALPLELVLCLIGFLVLNIEV